MIEMLSQALEKALSQPPAEAGMRLKSSRQLAKLLGTDHMTVQRAYDRLIADGILAQRHGSGTYLRKVTRLPGAEAMLARVKVGDKCFSANELFARPSRENSRRQMPVQQQQLHLEFWGHVKPREQHPVAKSSRSILDGIVARARQTGHRITLHDFLSDLGQADVLEELRQRLRRTPGDGYIVESHQAHFFQQAFGRDLPPCVYIFTGKAMADCEPIIRLDQDEALVRGLRLLAGQGAQRIGLFGLGQTWRTEQEQHLYAATLADLGLTYRAAEFPLLHDSESIRAAVARLFSSSAPPEAVYCADDVLLHDLIPAFAAKGIRPGRNLALITMANVGNPLPRGYNWSRLEFSPVQVGRLVVDSLVQDIQTAGEELCSFSHQAAWKPGDTHRSQVAPSAVSNEIQPAPRFAGC
jgi:DNA-binding LacI/PurR family transcriptional regulator